MKWIEIEVFGGEDYGIKHYYGVEVIIKIDFLMKKLNDRFIF